MKENINKLNKRILEISIKHKLSHLGSCFTALPIIYEIYFKKRPEDKFVLSNGHAGLALYVVLEHFYGVDAEHLLETYGIHPERDLENFIDVSTGSLGLGITIATGMALANPNIKIYCTISDGESAEGSIWEALRFIDENQIKNIEIHANINGWAAYKSVDSDKLSQRLKSFLPEINIHYTDVNEIIQFETSLAAHYTMANNNMKIK
jgi:transketolase N-terminal domain/subunit